MQREVGVETRQAVLDVFCRHSMANKLLAVEFFNKYLDTLAKFTEDETQFFISIMQTSSIIFKDLPNLMKQETIVIKEFVETIAKLFDEMPVQQLSFERPQNLQRLVTFSIEILLHQLKNRKEIWFNSKICESLANMLMTILDNSEYTLNDVENLKLLFEVDHQDTIGLMKHLVLAELNESDFNPQLSKASPSWKIVHDRLLRTIDDLQTQNSLFNHNMYSIYDFFLLAIQIDFSFTHQSQLRHGLNPHMTTTQRSFSIVMNSQEPLMQFRDWDYKHVCLVMFDDIEIMTQKILAALEQRREIDLAIAKCAIDVFSCILKFSNIAGRFESIKLILMAIVASPFYKSLKDDLQFNKLGGFQKVMSVLPPKFKAFYEKPMAENMLVNLKRGTIAQLAQIEVSRLNGQCWWLVDNIIKQTLTQTDEAVKLELMKSYPNFMINNSDKANDLLNIYQKQLGDFKNPLLSIESLKEVLCLSKGNLVIIKQPSKESTFNHFIVCDDCQLESTLFDKDPEVDEATRWMGFVKHFKGILISSDCLMLSRSHVDYDPSKGLHSNDFKIQFFPKIPALLNHSKQFRIWVRQDDAKALFKELFAVDEAVLGALEANLRDILVNIIKRNKKSERAVLDNCIAQLFEVTRVTGDNVKLQSLTVQLNYIMSTCGEYDENMLVKCFKLFLLYIIPNSSKVMGEASLLAMKMATFRSITLTQLLNWHKTFIIRSVMQLVMMNFGSHETPMSSSLVTVSSYFSSEPTTKTFKILSSSLNG